MRRDFSSLVGGEVDWAAEGGEVAEDFAALGERRHDGARKESGVGQRQETAEATRFEGEGQRD